MLKKILALIFVVFILFNVGGYFICFYVQQLNIQHQVKEEIKKGLKDKDLTLIKVNKSQASDLIWEEKDKEFSLNDCLYDVVNVKDSGNWTYYFCLNDVSEKLLVNKFQATQKRENETEKRLKKVLDFQFLFHPLLEIKCNSFSNIIYGNGIQLFESNPPRVISPPPKSLIS